MNTISLHNEPANDLYAMLSPEQRAALAKHERSITVPGGTALIAVGVLPEQLVIVNSGKVEIVLAGMRESISLGEAEGGRVFGMRAVVSGDLPEADITSAENCLITLIPRNAFLTTVREHPQMYFAIAKVLSNELFMAHRFLKTSLRRPLRRKALPKALLSWPQ